MAAFFYYEYANMTESSMTSSNTFITPVSGSKCKLYELLYTVTYSSNVKGLVN